MLTAQANPIDLSDEELEERYRQIWAKAQAGGHSGTLADLLTTEMNRRHAEGISKGSRKISVVSLVASSLALFFASISAYFSFIDWKEDQAWQTEQIDVLVELQSELMKLNKQGIELRPMKEKSKELENSNLHEKAEPHNKVKNENTSKAGSDAHSARPF